MSSQALHRALWIAFAFMVMEVVGAFVANSLALFSDALHMFTDVGALFLSLIVAKIAHRPSTPTMSYGYGRAEIIGALASSASLWALSIVLIYESFQRLHKPDLVEGPIVFVVATIGLIANFWMMRVLHPSQHHSLNVKAAYLHVLGDLLGSIGVILSGLILWITGWTPIDALVTIVFTASILYHSWKVIKNALTILMESTPEGFDPTKISQMLREIPEVQEVQDLHIWAVSPQQIALSVHLVTHSSEALSTAHKVLEEKCGIHHTTIQIEDPNHFQRKLSCDCRK